MDGWVVCPKLPSLRTQEITRNVGILLSSTKDKYLGCLDTHSGLLSLLVESFDQSCIRWVGSGHGNPSLLFLKIDS